MESWHSELQFSPDLLRLTGWEVCNSGGTSKQLNLNAERVDEEKQRSKWSIVAQGTQCTHSCTMG